MKNKLLCPFLIGVVSSSVAYSGAMGDRMLQSYKAFILAEGGYTWNPIQGLDLNISEVGGLFSKKTNQGGSARVALGSLHALRPHFSLSGELGWGYYGKTTIQPIPTGSLALNPFNIVMEHTLSGFDVLAGIVYDQPRYNLFLKAGGLIQNDLTNLTLQVPSIASLDLRNNYVQAMPTLKVGGSYLMNEYWSIVASYMHAFGTGPNIKVNVSTLANLELGARNSSLNVALGGIQFTI